MYININNKLIELNQNEYEAFIESQTCNCDKDKCQPKQINKMEELLSLDFSDGETRTALQISLYIKNLFEKYSED